MKKFPPSLLNQGSPVRGQLMQIVTEPPPIVMPPRAEDSAPTRQSLLMRLQRGDETAGWREFFDAYWELVYNVARNAGLNDAEAQDAVQDTVIAVAQKIPEFKTGSEHGSFKSWLLGQARWQIGNQFRTRQRKKRLFDELPAVAVDDQTATEPLHRLPDPAGQMLECLWDEEWERHVLRGALDRVQALVTVKQFQMFDLHVNQGLSVAETARAVGSTMAAVYMAKSRVGRVLRREIERFRHQER